MNRTIRPAALAGLLALLTAACGTRERDASPPPSSAGKGGGHGHTHVRGKLLIADAGEHHATLTAHLSPKGNELVIGFETVEDEPTPVAIAATSFKAYARRSKEGEPKELTFECASPRPKGERDGTCSHFVARAPWLTRDEVIDVTIPSLKVGGRTSRVQWKRFTAAKYASREE
jgi:hypothetical protein